MKTVKKDKGLLRQRQQGISLVELLVASTIGLLTLAVVGTVFISGQNFASERSKQLMLAQDINDALRLIKTDVHRAGYTSDSSSGSLVLSGATSTIYVPEPGKNAISYIYEDENSDWRVVKFDVSKTSEGTKTLRICEDRISKGVATIPTDATCGSGKTAFLIDPAYFSLSNFTVTPKKITTSSAISTLIDVSISVSLKDSKYTKSASTMIKARNWSK